MKKVTIITISIFISFILMILGFYIFIILNAGRLSRKTYEKEKKYFLEELASYEHNDKIIYRNDNIMYYMGKAAKLDGKIEWIDDICIIYYNDNQKKHIYESNDGAIQVLPRSSLRKVYHKNSIVIYYANYEYYEYNLETKDEKKITEYEYYNYRNGKYKSVENRFDEIIFEFDDNIRKEISVDTISNYFPNLLYLNRFNISYYLFDNNNNLYLGLYNPEWCFVVIQFDVYSDTMSIFDWVHIEGIKDYSFEFNFTDFSDSSIIDKYFIL